MNLASWIILGIVAVAVALAARATFFTAKRGGCCGSKEPGPAAAGASCSCDEAAAEACGCGGCSGCKGCSTAHVLQPTIRPVE